MGGVKSGRTAQALGDAGSRLGATSPSRGRHRQSRSANRGASSRGRELGSVCAAGALWGEGAGYTRRSVHRPAKGGWP